MTGRLLDAALVAAALLALWQGIAWFAGDVALTGPAQTFAAAIDLWEAPRFYRHLGETLAAFAQALAISWLGGLGLGVALGASRLAGEVVEPVLVALYSLPKVTLYPMILLIFGLGMPAKVAFGALHGIAPVVIFTLNAVRNIKPVHLKTAAALRLPPLRTALKVLVPAALPEVVSGLRIGFSLTLLGVLLGEMFASKQGLGFMIINAIERNDVETMMAVTLLLFLFAGAANAALLAVDRHLHARAA